jgi:hypothetical protein
MSKRVIVGDLKDGDNGENKPFLYCPKCCSRFSADARDYWNASPATVLKHCGRNMVRLIEHRTFEEVSS